jgi:threonine synthase
VATPIAERYRDRLPVTAATPLVSLGEGSTPLLPAGRLSERFGLDVWLKWEGANPTGSFKDRGMAVAVAKAVEEGFGGVVCASTGNTSASAAAYAARAGLEAVVLVPSGAVSAGKLHQARAHGADVREVDGSFEDAYAAALELAATGTHAFVNSANPYRLEGQKTAALEIVEELGVPDVLALPYGGGGNTCAYARGFDEAGEGFPRLVAAQAAKRASTMASAIRIVQPVHRADVERAVARSGGEILSVADEEIAAAWRLLAREEGCFCEPASAASVAALTRVEFEPGTRVVCVLTGHGLKDPGAVP